MKKLKRFSIVFEINFAGISLKNLLETLLVPKGNLGGFKRLVACAKCNRDSYKNELGFYFLFLGFLVYFTRGRAKLTCEGICSTLNYDILCPFVI